MKFMEMVKNKIRTWLDIQTPGAVNVNITQARDFFQNAYRNIMWYRGIAEELKQFYGQLSGDNITAFWNRASDADIRMIHTGLPRMIVNMLAKIAVGDLVSIDLPKEDWQKEFDAIAEENKFRELLKEATKDALAISDCVFTLSVDPSLSAAPIVEVVSGEKVEYKTVHGRIKEIFIRKRVEDEHGKLYTFVEHYGYGFINYHLYDGDREIDRSKLPEYADYQDVEFNKSVILAIPFRIYNSDRYLNRGASCFEGKVDNFDALDECVSLWYEAVHRGMAQSYIPDDLIPRDPQTQEPKITSSYKNKFIAVNTGAKENDKTEIHTEQANIPTDNYLQTYITSLDLCLQGLISPSTLGIDVKKLDNAESQREKEKTTLYTRQDIIEALDVTVPKLVALVLKTQDIMNGRTPREIDPEEIKLSFGEYNSPAFETVVETVTKAKTANIMSNETIVEELWGDTKDDDWKAEEVKRLNARDGLSELGEPAVNSDVDEDNQDNAKTTNTDQDKLEDLDQKDDK